MTECWFGFFLSTNEKKRPWRIGKYILLGTREWTGEWTGLLSSGRFCTIYHFWWVWLDRSSLSAFPGLRTYRCRYLCYVKRSKLGAEECGISLGPFYRLITFCFVLKDLQRKAPELVLSLKDSVCFIFPSTQSILSRRGLVHLKRPIPKRSCKTTLRVSNCSRNYDLMKFPTSVALCVPSGSYEI